MSAFFATCPKGIEYLLRDELVALGIEAHEALAGVHFTGGLDAAYRACLESRLASRVLLTLAEFDAPDAGALYAAVQAVDWSRHLAPDATLAIDAMGTSGSITHSGFAAQKAKDAIVDQCRERFGMRPTVKLDHPDVRLNLRLHRGRGVLSLDLAGEPLHRRGWRVDQGEAPLKENLACAMLLRAGWPGIYAGGGALVDPMCGSGTLLIEGAWMAAGVAPGLKRAHFGFLGWRGHDAELWQRLRGEAAARATAALPTLRPCFFGSDSDAHMLRVTTRNLQSAGVAGFANIAKRGVEFLDPPPGFTRGLVITNPPYGERMGDPDTLPAMHRAFGARLRRGFAGWRAAVLTSDMGLAHALAFRNPRRYVLFNGAIECRLVVAEVAAEAEPDAALSPGATMVANRIRKNVRTLRRALVRDGVGCFRAYDADLPEYAAAIDVYRGWPEGSSTVGEAGSAEDWLHVQEYAPPATVPVNAARARWHDLLRAARDALAVPRERVAIKTRVRGRGGARYGRLAARGEFLVVEEGGLRFRVNLYDHLDTGLFLDHRLVRAKLRELSRDRDVLNLFAYTGAASVYAAAGAARTTTSVDLSGPYLDWASRNLALNGFTGPAHRLAQADALAFLRSSPGHARYGVIYVDPPTFSNSKRAGDFDVQRDHVALLTECVRHLAPAGIILFSNNYRRFRLDAAALSGPFELQDVGAASIPPDFVRHPRIHGCWLLRKRSAADSGSD